MMVTHGLRQKMVLLSMFFVVSVGFFVTACGASSSSTGGPSTPSPTPTLAIVPGSGSAYGCPSDVVVSTAPAASDITLQPQQSATTINVKKGAVLEVQMPFGVAWQGPTTSQSVLQLQEPAGYAWKASNSCIWRFVAEQAGTVTLHFFGRAICKKTHLCVPSVEATAFTVQVV
jgi:hypothetical protein